MRGNVFLGLWLVRIIEVPDKRGLDNRGCTVHTLKFNSWHTNSLFAAKERAITLEYHVLTRMTKPVQEKLKTLTT